MKIGAIIFFRMNSSRLPGKPLLKFEEKTLIELIYDRVLKIKGLDEIVIATSEEVLDNQIVIECKNLNIKVYRGSLNNVADRALQCALLNKMDYFVRICGDRPFFDYELINRQIRTICDFDYDIVTNCFPKTYPKGMDSEIISTKILRDYITFFDDKEENEHLTKYFYTHHSKFKIFNYKLNSNENLSNFSLAVDDEEDYKKTIFLLNEIKKSKTKNLNIKEKIKILQKYKKKLNKS
jgi:spore coat polysaccharide biosynthesis protein SpsF